MTSTSHADAFDARSWPIRSSRAFAGATVSVLLAVGGHRLGGGDIVSIPVLGAVFATVLATGLLVTGRRLAMGQIIGMLLIGQILVHLGCLAGAESASVTPAMVIGHLIATLGAALVLRSGEHVLWTLVDRLGLRRLRMLLGVVAISGAGARIRTSYDAGVLRLDVLGGGTGLRGPPVGSA